MTVTELIESIEDVSKRLRLARLNSEELADLEEEACTLANEYVRLRRIAEASGHKGLRNLMRETYSDVICLLDEFD